MRDKFGASTTATLLMAAVLAAALICALNSNSADARYLPTRSDKSEIETLKEIIKGLLVESGVPLGRQQMYQHRPISSAGYLQRRAAEMSVSSSNGGEESDAGYLASPFDSTGSQMFKPMNQRPDR